MRPRSDAPGASLRSWRAFAVIAVATAAIVPGCASEPPDVTYNLPSRHDLFDPDLVLTEGDREEVLAIMRGTVPCDEPVEIAPAKYGVRWRDVDSAVRWGSSVVEMAVLSAESTPDRWTYRIITAADDPVTLVVTREPPPVIYSASAVAGVFGDRRDIEARLLEEVHRSMRAFGAKPLPVVLDE